MNIANEINQILEKLDKIEAKLDERSIRFMTIKELSKYLNLSKSHIYHMTHANKIPHYKPGGKKIYFERMEINRWILKYPIRTDEEYDATAKSFMKMKKKKK